MKSLCSVPALDVVAVFLEACPEGAPAVVYLIIRIQKF